MFGYDAIHANITAIPAGAYYVFGYVSGSPDIVWSQIDYDRFPHATKEYIDQGNGHPWRIPTILDVENGAITPNEVPMLARMYPGVKVYCNQSTLSAVYNTGWRGKVWVAAPGSQAANIKAAVEHNFPGFEVFAVQDTWQSTYDRSTVFVNVPPPPPPVPHIDIQGFQVRRPGNGIIPAVISWWGDNGVVTRESNIPAAVWDQIHWSGK
jgi:hypothetical protein